MYYWLWERWRVKKEVSKVEMCIDTDETLHNDDNKLNIFKT